jgi:copper chaperone CopZ
MVAEYTVSGMTCEHCVAHVKEEVGAIAGVTHTQLDLTGKLIVESYEPVPFEALQAAVAEAGDYTLA